jgi:hypothetical protein
MVRKEERDALVEEVTSVPAEQAQPVEEQTRVVSPVAVSGVLFDDPAKEELFYDAMGMTLSELEP